jgi:hypothetical protein
MEFPKGNGFFTISIVYKKFAEWLSMYLAELVNIFPAKTFTTFSLTFTH